MWYNDYMAGGLACPQLDQNAAYKTPEPITACVAGDGSTVIAYYYEIANTLCNTVQTEGNLRMEQIMWKEVCPMGKKYLKIACLHTGRDIPLKRGCRINE